MYILFITFIVNDMPFYNLYENFDSMSITMAQIIPTTTILPYQPVYITTIPNVTNKETSIPYAMTKETSIPYAMNKRDEHTLCDEQRDEHT